METIDVRKEIERRVKTTVGHAEAENKESFMVGVSVAISQAEEIYGKQLTDLKQRADMYESLYNNVNHDLKTLCKIIQKHSDNE